MAGRFNVFYDSPSTGKTERVFSRNVSREEAEYEAKVLRRKNNFNAVVEEAKTNRKGRRPPSKSSSGMQVGNVSLDLPW